MINPFSPLTGSTQAASTALTTSQDNSAPLDIQETFQQILQLSLLSSTSSSDSSQGFDPQSLMMPLMLMLMEQLIERTTETSSTSESSAQQVASSTSTVTDDPNVGGGRILPATSTNSSQPSGRPVGGVLTQGFHSGHNGLDFGIPVGTAVRSTMSGKVIYAGWNDQGYGNLVIVENGPYRTYYAHLSSIPVQIGDQVSSGETIGLSGNTGNSTGPHLHYEVRYNMQAIDPTSFTL